LVSASGLGAARDSHDLSVALLPSTKIAIFGEPEMRPEEILTCFGFCIGFAWQNSDRLFANFSTYGREEVLNVYASTVSSPPLGWSRETLLNVCRASKAILNITLGCGGAYSRSGRRVSELFNEERALFIPTTGRDRETPGGFAAALLAGVWRDLLCM
jgi:hypothetical protein